MTVGNWITTYTADPALARLCDRHYSRKTVGSRRFHPPGKTIELYIPGRLWPFECAAGWVWWLGYRRDSFTGWIANSLFRNEASGVLSSELIREAVEIAVERWGPPELGFDTYVWPEKLQSVNPGYCYVMAGWHRGGWTRDGKKRRLYLPADEV